jgi:hypothetical protein
MAGEVNYGLVNPAVLDYAGQEQKTLNVQKSRLDVQRLEEERKLMLGMQKQLADSGQDPDLNIIFDTMIKSGNPDYMSKGLEGKFKLKEQQDFARIMGYGGQDVTPAPTAPGAYGAPMTGAAPTNALIPMGGARQPAPGVNALAPANDESAALSQKINSLVMLGTPQALKVADVLQKQLTALEPTADVKNFRYGEKNPAFLNYQTSQRRAGATTVNMPPQEKAEQTERGKFLVDDYKTINTAARVAARTLPAIEVNTALIDKGFETGFTAETKKGAASVLAALGVKDAADFATDAQIFQSKASETVLQRQLEQKGPQTESDAQRITQTNAQLGNTTDANKFILAAAKAQLKRDIEQRNYYDNWFTKNKTYDGAENAWYNGEGGKSLFDRPELKKYNISPNKPSSGSQKTTGGLSSTEQAELDSLRARFKR